MLISSLEIFLRFGAVSVKSTAGIGNAVLVFIGDN